MKFKNIFLQIIFIACTFSWVSCSDDDDLFVLRNTDVMEFSYTASEQEFTVCTNGSWSIATDDDWLSFATEDGSQTGNSIIGIGDGTTREIVKVYTAKNSSDARIGEFVLHAAGKDLPVSVTQELGKPLTFGDFTFSKTVQQNEVMEGVALQIPYTYATIGETHNLTAVVSGEAADGILADDVSVVFDSDAGVISIPISGTPTELGDVTFTISDATGVISEGICSVAGEIYLEQYWDLMTYGGDVINDVVGIVGTKVDDPDGTGKTVVAPFSASSSGGTDGSSDMTTTMSDSYRAEKGFTGWGGHRIYEKPGYLKIGTGSSDDGHLITPALTGIGDETVNLSISVKLSQYYQCEDTEVTCTALNAGTCQETSYALKSMSSGTRSWETVNFTIEGATSATQIQFAVQNEQNHRFLLDNLVIARAK